MLESRWKDGPERSIIARNFAGSLAAWLDVNASVQKYLTDEKMSLATSILKTAEEATMALLARDVSDVWCKVAVTITGAALLQNAC